ncbi:MAG: hypothetical protein ACAI38_13310 [Myxococcota bacterium]
MFLVRRAGATPLLVAAVFVSTALAWVVPVLWPTGTTATPLYAIRSAAACNTCHIEPAGWYNPPDDAGRKCTLDCTGCHISKTGGGLRTATGDFYGYESLAMFGSHPGDGVDPSKYRDPDDSYSTKGRYRFWEGFSGWQAGKTPMVKVKDRFGPIEPDPKLKWGADVRIFGYLPLGSEESPKVFPMQAEVYGFAKPAKNISIYGTVGLQGDRRDLIQKGEWHDRFAIRELWIQADNFKNNGYVRAGRFTKPFGWRHPNHTLFTRAGLDYDQYAQVFGAEIGVAPNYPYANLAVFYQGIEKWPGEQQDTGYGAALTAGVRDLGWQLGGSAEILKITEAGTTNIGAGTQVTAGPLWALNLYPFTILGEADFRAYNPVERADTAYQLFIFHELDYMPTRGINIFGTYEWQDVNLVNREDHRQRFSVGADWNIYKGWQVTAQYRRLYQATTFLSNDLLLMLHFWI